MKKLLIAVLAMASLVACNKNEVIEQAASPAIQFENAFVDNATRAAVDPSTTTSSLTAFSVYGYMDNISGVIFDAEEVTGSGKNWSYENTQYWTPSHKYYFAALAPVGGYTLTDIAITDAGNVVGKVAFTNANGTSDLIYATANAVTKETIDADKPGKVEFTFNHQLSKIKFSFTNGMDNKNAKVVVKDIKMVVHKSGSLDLTATTPAWTLVGTETTTLDFGTTQTIEQNVAEECAQERLTIPAGKDVEYAVSFVVDLYYGTELADSYVHEVAISGNEFEIGKAYNFHATLTSENITADEVMYPIEFTAAVENWVDGNVTNGGETFDSQVTDEATLQNAINRGGNIVLQNDITISSAINVPADVVVSLDLNGKTITNKVDNANTDIFFITAGGELTISGDGEVIAVSGNDGYPVNCQGKITINGGKFTSGKDANGYANACIYAKNNGEVYVNGGEFKSEGVYTLNKHDDSKNTATLEVRGGKFINFNPASTAADNPVANYVAKGYKSVPVEGSTTDYEVVPMNEVEKAIQNGDATTITLTEDLTMTEASTITKDLTINLNGKDIVYNGDDILFRIADGATLTINGSGNFTTSLYVASANAGGKIVVTGDATFTCGTTCFQANGGNIEIYGGNFNVANETKKYMLNHIDGQKNNGSIIVYGGTFNGYNPAKSASENPVMNFVASGYQSTETAEGSNVWVVAPIE